MPNGVSKIPTVNPKPPAANLAAPVKPGWRIQATPKLLLLGFSGIREFQKASLRIRAKHKETLLRV